MKKHFISRVCPWLFVMCSVLLGIFGFSSCSDDDDNNDVPVAGLMTFNLAPDQGAIAITLSGNTLPGAPLYYLAYSGVYLNILAADRTVRTHDFIQGNVIATSTYKFERDRYYSQFFVGAKNNYSNLVVMDNLDSLASASTQGNAYIRYVNAIPDSAKPLVTITANGTNVVSNNTGYATLSGFIAVPPGQVNITVTNGSTNWASRTIDVEQLNVYTVLLAGIPGSTDASRSVKIKYVVNGILSERPPKQDSAAVAESQ